MNNKIPVSKLAEATAARAGCTPAEAIQLIKDLFAIVEADIMAGGEPEIAGLGRFAKSTVPGEPLVFIPDEDFAALLNEDFASFSSVKLNEGVTEEILAEAEEPEEETDTDEVSITEDSATDKVVPASNEPATDLTEEIVEEALIEVSAPDAGEESPPELPEEVKEEEKTTERPQEMNSDNTPEGEEAGLQVETSVDIDAAAENQDEIEAQVEDIVESDDAAKQTGQDSGIDHIEEEEVEYVVVRKQKSHFWTGLLIGFILGFAIGVIAYLCYMLQILKLPVEDITGL